MSVAFIFPGQGSQAIGMGKDFFDNSSEAKEAFEMASEVLKFDMQNLLFNQNDDINQTRYTQPAILLVSYIANMLFRKSCDMKPEFALGHSLGEISANVAASSINISNALSLVYSRGLLMQQACDGLNAGMAVVMGLEDSVMENFCTDVRKNGGKIWCANYNGDGQIVLAGAKSDLVKAESEIKNLGAKRFLILPMSVASHCPLLDGMCDEFGKILDSALMDNFDFEIISNATIEAYSSKKDALNLLTRQLIEPVFYKQSITQNSHRIDCFIEFGHGSVLKGLNKRLSDKPTYSVSSMASLEETLREIGA